MNDVLIRIKEVLSLSTVESYSEIGFTGRFIAENTDKIKKILQYTEEYTDSDNYILINFHHDDLSAPLITDFSIGAEYLFDLSVNVTSVRSTFFSNYDYLLSYILTYFEIINWDNKIILPFENDLYPEKSKYHQYFIYLNELIVLYAKYAYLDGHRRIVLFTDKPLVIYPNAKEGFNNTFKEVFDSISIEDFKDSIHELKRFLNDETVDKHKKEKQSIFIMETTKFLESYDSSDRFYQLVKNIHEISSYTISSFQAYLNDFSYQKLELELRKDLDYFVKSVNDSLGSLQAQALGLPIAAALIQLNKVNLLISYIALILFSGFVMLNVFQQEKQLAYIQVSIDRFFTNGNVKPIVSKDKLLSKMQDILDSRLNFISIYLKIVLSVATLILVYGFSQFLDIVLPEFKNFALIITCIFLIVAYIYIIRKEYIQIFNSLKEKFDKK